jgi:replication factor C small subunit
LGDVPFKLIYLDECDALTREAQQALRRTMENYTNTCRFVLSCNYSSKIIDPIQSRCALFRFKPLKKDDVLEIIKKISVNEKVKVDPKAMDALFIISEGDCRRVENIFQACAAISDHITEDIVYSMASVARPVEVKEVLEFTVKGKFLEAKKHLLDTMLNYGLSGTDLIKQIQAQIWELSVDPRKRLEMIKECGEAEFRLVEGSDEFIQLEALLSKFVLINS